MRTDGRTKRQTDGRFTRLCDKSLKKEEHGNRPAAISVRARPACPRLHIEQLHSGIVCYTLDTLEEQHSYMQNSSKQRDISVRLTGI